MEVTYPPTQGFFLSKNLPTNLVFINKSINYSKPTILQSELTKMTKTCFSWSIRLSQDTLMTVLVQKQLFYFSLFILEIYNVTIEQNINYGDII